MKDTRNARERLDAVLTGLEDEVMRGEGSVGADVEGMRAEMEALIERHGGRSASEAARASAGGVKGKVAMAKELLGRWAGIGARNRERALVPRVRMAFSGEREPEGVGDHESGSGSDRTRGGKEGGEV